MRDLEAQGVKTTIIVDPGVKKDEGYRVCDEGLAQDAFVKYPDGTPYTGAVWPGECHFPDFTKPSARAWFGGYYEELLEQGVKGIWMDMNEPSNFHMRTIPDVALHDFEGRGGTHLEAHNVYGLVMAQATYEALRRYAPDERPFLITRAAFSGSQRYTCGWTGDNVSSWEHLQPRSADGALARPERHAARRQRRRGVCRKAVRRALCALGASRGLLAVFPHPLRHVQRAAGAVELWAGHRGDRP